MRKNVNIYLLKRAISKSLFNDFEIALFIGKLLNFSMPIMYIHIL